MKKKKEGKSRGEEDGEEKMAIDEVKVPLDEFIGELVSALDARLTKQDRHIGSLIGRVDTFESRMKEEAQRVEMATARANKAEPMAGVALESKLDFWHKKHDSDVKEIIQKIETLPAVTVSASLLNKLEV